MSGALVVVVMGSESDLETMKPATRVFKEFNVPYSVEIVSAHRTPKLLEKSVESWEKNGVSVIVAGAGGAAHLPGMLASYSVLPVIGVPVKSDAMDGLDALLSIAQMPAGVPVACVGVGNATNAALLAVQILGCGNQKRGKVLTRALGIHKRGLVKKVEVMRKKLTRRKKI